MRVTESTPITRLEFDTADDQNFKTELYRAILRSECPDFIRVETDGGLLRPFAAYWATERVSAVCDWVTERCATQGRPVTWVNSSR